MNNVVTLKSALEVSHSRSFKLVSFERLGAVSYSLSIVSMTVSVAVCEYLASKSGVTLKKGLGSFKVIGNGTI